MIFKNKKLTAIEDAQKKAHLSNDRLQSLGSIDKELEKINKRNENFIKRFIGEQENITAVFGKYRPTLTDELNSIVQTYLENQAENMDELLEILEYGIKFRQELQKETESVQQETKYLIKTFEKIAK